MCDKTITENSLGLLVYQTFNLFVMSPAVDFVWPWFYLEWQKDVDVITKFKKPPPKAKRSKPGDLEREDTPPREMITLDHKDGDDDETKHSETTAPLPEVRPGDQQGKKPRTRLSQL